MKIQIIGYSGSGKSTLAKRLGEFQNIAYLHLDNTHWYGDWQERTIDEQEKLVRDFMKDKSSWIIDGNYSKVAPERFVMADITIFLNYNRFYCYKMARRRYKELKGKIRESCPCDEKFDWEFKKWILFTGRTGARKKMHSTNLNKGTGEKIIFKNKKALNKWLMSLGASID